MEQEKELTNTFRNSLEAEKETANPVMAETERVGEDEMMRRDTHIALREIQLQAKMKALDLRHNQKAIQIYTDFVAEIEVLQICFAKEGILQAIRAQIQALEKHVAQSIFSRSSQVTLNALSIADEGMDDGTDEAAPASKDAPDDSFGDADADAKDNDEEEGSDDFSDEPTGNEVV